MLMTQYHHLAVILDLNCSGSSYLLAQVGMKVYSEWHQKCVSFLLGLISLCAATKCLLFGYFRESIRYIEYVALDKLLGQYKKCVRQGKVIMTH
jgi:hypothetical protein